MHTSRQCKKIKVKQEPPSFLFLMLLFTVHNVLKNKPIKISCQSNMYFCFTALIFRPVKLSCLLNDISRAEFLSSRLSLLLDIPSIQLNERREHLTIYFQESISF